MSSAFVKASSNCSSTTLKHNVCAVESCDSNKDLTLNNSAGGRLYFLCKLHQNLLDTLNAVEKKLDGEE